MVVRQWIVSWSALSTAHQSVSNWRQSPVGHLWPEPIRGRNIPKNPRIAGIQDPTVAGITGSGVFFGNTAYQPAGTCHIGMPRNRSRIRYGAFCEPGGLLVLPACNRSWQVGEYLYRASSILAIDADPNTTARLNRQTTLNCSPVDWEQSRTNCIRPSSATVQGPDPWWHSLGNR